LKVKRSPHTRTGTANALLNVDFSAKFDIIFYNKIYA